MVTAVVAILCVGAGTTTFFVVKHLTEPRQSTGRPVALPTADPTETPADVPTDVPTDPATGPSDVAVEHTGDLEGLVAGPPKGARTWPGVEAAEALTDTTAAADLAALGMGPSGDLGEYDLDDLDFADGYVRRWIDQHGAYVTVRVYRFDHPDGGVEFTNIKAGDADGGVWGKRHSIKGAPDAAGFVQPKVKNGLQQVLVIGGFSDIAVLVTTRQPAPATITEATSVFGTERKKL